MHPKSLLKACLSRATLPLFLCGILYSIEVFADHGAFAGDNSKSSFDNGFKGNTELAHPIVKLITEIRSGILACYQDFPQFLLMMFCLSLVSQISTFLKFWTKTVTQTLRPSWNKEVSSTAAKEERGGSFGVKLAQNILCYTLIFSLIQILATTPIFSNNPSLSISSISQTPPLEGNPLRLLEEERVLNNGFSVVDQEPQNGIKSLSLSIGKVLSSINIDPTSIILSKDKRYAFSMSHYYGTLKVIDITNLKSPIVVNSITLLKSQESRFKYGALLLSEDGNTLFISNILNFQIVNVQDPRSPVLLGKFRDGKVLNDAYYRTYPSLYKTSMVVSKDLNALYVAGMNTQFFNISNFTEPKLVNATTNTQILVSNYIEADPYRQLLFKAEGNLSVHSFGDSGNSRVMEPSIPLTGGGSTSSFILSKDKKTLFVVSRQANNTLYFEKFDISLINEIKSIHSTVLPVISYENPVIIALSPCENYIFLSLRETLEKDLTLRVYDISQKKAQMTRRSLVKSTSSMVFSSDNRILIAATDKSFKIIELFTDFPNKRTFSLSANSLVNVLGEGFMNTLVLSPDQNTLFMCGGSRYNAKGAFQIIDVSNQYYPKIVSTYSAKQNSFTNLHYSTGAFGIFGLIYLQTPDGFTFLDISDQSSPSFVGKYSLPESLDKLLDSVILKGKSMGLTLQGHMQDIIFNSTIKFLHFHDYSDVEEIWSYPLPLADNNWMMKLSHDEKTLYVMQRILLIFDLGSGNTISLRGTYHLSSDSEKQQRVLSSALSKDDNTLFLKVEDDNSIFKLKIYDVHSNKNPPVWISEISLPLSVSGCTDEIALSPDSKRVYLAQLGSLLVIDVSDISSPTIIGIHKSFGLTSDHIDAFRIAEDEKSAYLVNFKGEVDIIRLEPSYSLFIKQENFKLGEKYSVDTRLLRLNGTAGYQPVSANDYKPLKVSLLDIQAIETENPTRLTVSSLPYWINYDRENLLFNLEPKTEGDLGTYTVCTTFSTKLSVDTFNQILFLSNVTTPQELVITLVALGYLDNRLFLTSEYGSLDDFLLPQQYQRIKDDVHYVLSQYHIETCTEFDITRSLEFKADSAEGLSIETPTTDYIKVEIKLTGKAKFLSLQDTHVQWLIGDERSRLTIEGSAKDVNLALKDVVVNFEKNDQVVDNATLTINDWLNPPLIKSIDDIARFFVNNKEPLVNPLKNIQSQIDSIQISTGQYFTLTLDEETFSDPNNQPLTYQLTTEDSTLPSWLSFNNLVLRGTPPEEFFGREVPLVLTAKNEYKNATATFTLHIRISPMYAIKLLMRFSPYILTVVGFWIFANKIYNILGKRRYKHTKEFYVEAGKEISPKVVFPIALIAEEKLESEALMDYLKEYMKKKSGKSLNNEGLVRCFIEDGRQLNKEKLLKALEESVMVAQEKNSKKMKFNLYLSEDEGDRFAVTRLILNQMILWQLNLKEEKSTLACFRRIKENWSEIVEFIEEKYEINQKKFETVVEGKSSHSGLEVRLLGGEDLNVKLLKDAILAHAFENQSLDVSAINIRISGMQKISENYLRRFFRLDLESIDFSSKGKLGYGIDYEISNEMLIFLGTPEKRFKGKTMMVQIMNKKQKILKEISVHGVASANYRGSKSFLDMTGVSSSDSDKLRLGYNVL